MALTDAKKASDARHNAKLDQIMIKPYKDEGEAIRAAAKDAGQSLQGYILQAVRDRMHPNDDMVRISVPRDQIQPLADAAGMTAKEYLAQALQDALTK